MPLRVKPKKPRNRAAQNTTLINLRPLKDRVATLERQVKAILTWRAAHVRGSR